MLVEFGGSLAGLRFIKQKRHREVKVGHQINSIALPSQSPPHLLSNARTAATS